MSTSLSLERSTECSDRLAACRLCGEVAAWQLPKTAQGPLIFRCRKCGVAFASHSRKSASPADVDHFGGIDEEKYFRSVMTTRLRSYSALLKRVNSQVAAGKWLDVGCSYGWLLQYVLAQGYQGEGIEPSAAAASRAVKQGICVRTGLFPAALARGEQFDVISFMDVLEHFEDPRDALEATREHLCPGGVVVIQVPDQACWLFRVAEGMYRLSGGRISFALRRLWLDGFDFPHQFYFTRHALSLVLQHSGFEVLDWQRTSIGHPAEALDRVTYAAGGGTRLRTAVVGMSVGLINAVDNACGHGGLLTMIARPH
ncbi:MAG: class I SAM-dependent methyltransferase [Pirellulaceae bacterium]